MLFSDADDDEDEDDEEAAKLVLLLQIRLELTVTAVAAFGAKVCCELLLVLKPFVVECCCNELVNESSERNKFYNEFYNKRKLIIF